MKKNISCIILISIFNLSIIGQFDFSAFKEEVTNFQKELNDQYSDTTHSPLTKKDIITFKGHDFFDANPVFSVTAKFKKCKNQQAFEMKTTTSRKPSYKKYGEIKFKINGKKFLIMELKYLNFLLCN